LDDGLKKPSDTVFRETGMIVTHKPKVPWFWVALITIPWMSGTLSGSVNGMAITYTIRKFVEYGRLEIQS